MNILNKKSEKFMQDLETFRGFNQEEWDKLNPNLRTLIGLRNHIVGKGYKLFKCIIEVLTDHKKRLKVIEAELGIYTDEEIKKVKVGGTDPD